LSLRLPSHDEAAAGEADHPDHGERHDRIGSGDPRDDAPHQARAEHDEHSTDHPPNAEALVLVVQHGHPYSSLRRSDPGCLRRVSPDHARDAGGHDAWSRGASAKTTISEATLP